MKNRKGFLIGGVILLVISACILWPLEYGKAQYITDFGFTFLTLGLGLLATMYGLMGENFTKGLTFILSSAVVGFVVWLIFSPTDFFSAVLAMMVGFPSGFIAGLIFLVINHLFLKDENRRRLFFKQLICYVVILFVVCMLFYKGGDWIDELSIYFNGERKPVEFDHL